MRLSNMAFGKQLVLQVAVITIVSVFGGTTFSQSSNPISDLPMSLPVPVIAAPSPLTALQTAPAPLGGALGVPVPTTPLDAGRLEMLDKDLGDLATMITGRWDNELQSFFEPELNIPLNQRHDRLHKVIRPIEGGSFGVNAFYVEYRSVSESGPIVRQRVWALSADGQLGALRLAAFTPKDGKALDGIWREPAKLAALNPADFVPVTGCDVIWRRRAEGFSGETRPGACKIATTGAGQGVLSVSERHDLSPNIWDVRDIGVDERGSRVFGSADNTPTRLRRAVPFVCWAGSRRGSESVTATDLILHDQGGVATATLAGATPSTVTLRLRNVDWPIGQNRPSLTLYVMTENDTSAKAFAWSEPDARRIALAVGSVQASCTRDESALWR